MSGFRFSDETLEGLERIQGASSTRRGKVDQRGNHRLGQTIASIDGGSQTPQLERNQRALETLGRTTRHTPQAVVKITGRIHGSANLLGSFLYVSRMNMAEQEMHPLETSEGKFLTRADDMMQLAREWHHWEMADEARRKGATALSMVFSMPPGTDAAMVREAVRDFAENDMSHFHWAMVLHTDEPHPHVHLIVANRDHDGRRFNPNREFLQRSRERFAENLRERGIDADATRRAARGYPPRRESMSVRNMRERGEPQAAKARLATDPHRAENVERVSAVYLRAADELEQYGGKSTHSCAQALRTLVASMSIAPADRADTSFLLTEKTRAALDRMTKSVEKLRALTAELKSHNTIAKPIDPQICQRRELLFREAKKVEQMILDRERAKVRDRERSLERDIDGPTR